MQRHVSLVAAALILFMAACQEESPTQLPAPANVPSATQALQASPEAGSTVAGEYIVVFTAAVADPGAEARRLVNALGGSLGFTYSFALSGFSASLPDQAVVALGSNPSVAYVAPNRVISLVATQANPTWGLDRIDQPDLPLSQSYTYGPDGTGVNVFIVDTGVRITHNEFGGRANYLPGPENGDFAGDNQGSADDCHGHGTHVAGTAAGTTYGVAKGANVWAARVLACDGTGTSAGLVAAVDAIVEVISTGVIVGPASANMSLSSGIFTDPPIEAAVASAVEQGVNFAVAAGNGFLGFPLDACTTSPANVGTANTVGATMIDDNEAPFSNYGLCVDLLAPGFNVTSAWTGADDATATISGTSMATPHVTGVTALYLEAFPAASPADVSAALVANAVNNTLTMTIFSDLYGTPNRLLNVEFLGGGGGGTPANQAPAAGFGWAATDLSVAFTDESTDGDGTVVGWSWDFGDGSGSTSQNPSHDYGSAGTYDVMLTVTDNDGDTDDVTQSVTVQDPPAGLTLNGVKSKVRGKYVVELTWTGASGPVNVYRVGETNPISPDDDDGMHSDPTGLKGKASFSFTYWVCEVSGSGLCSSNVTVSN